MQNKFIVITTINGVTEAIEQFSKFPDWTTIIIGDNKTPEVKSQGNIVYLSVKEQEKLGYKFTEFVPYNHYCRKNIGYLFAIKNGADIIYETDDDNIPYVDWKIPEGFNKEISFCNQNAVNICSLFTDKYIWPRGFPLEFVTKEQGVEVSDVVSSQPAVIQTLADEDPDVDAIYRLTNNTKVVFDKDKNYSIVNNIFAPFNSQSTFWTPKSFQAMYLPMFVSWRFCDILRSFIAQRYLWDNNLKLGYSSSVVYQKRNEHDYMKDFVEEIPVYKLGLKTLNLLGSTYQGDLIKIYTELKNNNIVSEDEIKGIGYWLDSF